MDITSAQNEHLFILCEELNDCHNLKVLHEIEKTKKITMIHIPWHINEKSLSIYAKRFKQNNITNFYTLTKHQQSTIFKEKITNLMKQSSMHIINEKNLNIDTHYYLDFYNIKFMQP